MERTQAQKDAFPPLRVGEERTFSVDTITQEGEGLSRGDGFVVFVPGALPGERVRARVVQVKRDYARAKLLALEAASPDRASPPCPVYGRCGGCTLQHATYEAQLRYKEEFVRDALRRLARIPAPPVLPIRGAEEPWRYRNKVQMVVGGVPGALQVGYYARGTHTLVPVADCLLAPEEFAALIAEAEKLFAAFGLAPYDEARRTGFVRHLVLRKSFAYGELMLVVVTARREFPQGGAFARELVRRFPRLVSVWQNVQPRPTNYVFGDEARLLYGREALRERLGELELDVTYRSFLQVNTLQAEALYREVEALGDFRPEDEVYEAYSGIGSLSLWLARAVRRVVGVEVVAEAVRDARENARRNGIANAEFHLGRAEEVFPRWAEQGRRADVVVVNPPRKGMPPEMIRAAAALSPRSVVYVSCNPATLARDVARFREHGFVLHVVRPVDLFPQTGHVESVAVLRRA
ncbi:MAG: RNA methyltransferase, TrmA family [Brockia lithotrophica]|uniref:RNA methyltransferase, TrmA family n=1 Tax=Brockia lithotrophica TaxID=933949 RepID=A0A2T5GAM8_9BACL|nr:MAG: RNA methyltransferase, TrmA family [Brockia lithotrophica]